MKEEEREGLVASEGLRVQGGNCKDGKNYICSGEEA